MITKLRTIATVLDKSHAFWEIVAGFTVLALFAFIGGISTLVHANLPVPVISISVALFMLGGGFGLARLMMKLDDKQARSRS
jgi:predicted small integral membrane protein